MQHDTSSRLFIYWNAVRNGRFAPNRFEIEPSSISELLPDVFILECPDNATYRFRLAGTRICSAMGHEMRGVNLLDYWSPNEREAVQNLLHNVAQDGAGAVIQFECQNAARDIARFELLVLPLVHSGATVTRMLGSMCVFDRPYWLGNAELSQPRLKSFHLVWPDLRPHLAVNAKSEAVQVRRAAQLTGETRRRFRVVEGGLSQRPNRV